MQDFLTQLNQYHPTDPKEQQDRELVLDFVRSEPHCFDHDCTGGQITGSSLVVSEDGREVILNHHKKLGRWIQFGGHCDGSSDVAGTALREAEEESGLTKLHFHDAVDGIFDISVHDIPEYQGKPAHLHYDIRYLLVGDNKEKLVTSHESHDLKWVPVNDVGSYNSEHDFARMIDKVRVL